MTSLAPPAAGSDRTAPSPSGRTVPSGLVARAHLRLGVGQGTAAWVLPATLAVLGLSAILYLVNLTVSGYANEYYGAAALAASQSWSAWFFGSLDAANFITIDKPPLATMVMGLSVRVFGLSSAALLVPEALMGVAAVGLLMATVRRTFGAPASIIAGLVMALTPSAVLMFRYNNPEALLTLLLVGSAYAFLRAIGDGRLRWLALAGVLVGLAFNTKLLQGWMVLPAFGLTWLLLGPGSVRRRGLGLAVALVAVVAASSWWLVGIALVPEAARPFVGGSTDGSALDLVLGYDGLGRIFGGAGNGDGGGGPSFSGTPGILRLFNAEMGGQIAWFLPLSLAGLLAGLVARSRRARTDLPRAAYLTWGLWLITHAVVFSLMSGVIHSYYTVIMAPAVGALVGGGVVELVRARARLPWTGVILGAGVATSAALAWALLDRTPSFLPGLGITVLGAGLALALAVALPLRIVPRQLSLSATGLALAVLLAGPGAYALSTMATAYSGGAVSAGPMTPGADGPGGAIRDGANPGPPAGQGASGPVPGGQGPLDGTPGTRPAEVGLPAGRTAGGPGGSLSATTLAYLVENRGTATWIVAVQSANSAAPIELSTGLPVMAMGGFTGSDPAPTLDQLKAYVASGELRFVMTGGGGGGPAGGSATISSWVSAACQAVSGASGLYDCAGAVG